MMIVGDPGTGKTHLSHAFTGQLIDASATQASTSLDYDNDLAIDNAESMAEEALFHIINASLAHKSRLLLLSCKHPLEWDIKLKDLQSRLLAMRIIDMPEPDDELLRAILIQRFAVHCITPSTDCLDALIKRMERSGAEAHKIVTELIDYAGGRSFSRQLAIDFMLREEKARSETLSFLSDDDSD